MAAEEWVVAMMVEVVMVAEGKRAGAMAVLAEGLVAAMAVG